MMLCEGIIKPTPFTFLSLRTLCTVQDDEHCFRFHFSLPYATQLGWGLRQ